MADRFNLKPSVGTWLHVRTRSVLNTTRTVVAAPADGLFFLLPSVGTWYVPRRAERPAQSREQHVPKEEKVATDTSLGGKQAPATPPSPPSATPKVDEAAPPPAPIPCVAGDSVAASLDTCTNVATALAKEDTPAPPPPITADKDLRGSSLVPAAAPVAEVAFSAPEVPVPPPSPPEEASPAAAAAAYAPLQVDSPPRAAESPVDDRPGSPPRGAAGALPEAPASAGGGRPPRWGRRGEDDCSGSPPTPDSTGFSEGSLQDHGHDGRVPLLRAGSSIGGLGRPRGIRAPLAACERRRVSSERRRFRDAWNTQELRLTDVLSRLKLLDSEGLEDEDLRVALGEFLKRTPFEEEVQRITCLATRGRPVLPNIENFHYAVRSQQASMHLPKSAVQRLADTDLGLPGACDSKRIHTLLEQLNGGLPVHMAQADMVMYEASLMAGDRLPGRADLIPAIAGWYLNVERRRTDTNTLLRTWLGRWLPEDDFLPSLVERLSSEDAGALEAEAAAEAAASSRNGSISPGGPSAAQGRVAHASQRVQSTAYSLVLALLVVFPTMFFAWLVFVASRHGDNRCPKDLDGLLLWFGILGIAALAVDCVDGLPPCASWVRIVLKSAMILLSWTGAFWTFSLQGSAHERCGVYLTTVSAFLWTALVTLQILGALFLFWEMSAIVEHEQSLHQLLGGEDDLDP